MKTIRVRDKFYNKVKDIAERKKITIGEAVEMVASYNNHDYCDLNHGNRGHTDLESNHNNHDNYDIRNHGNHSRDRNESDFVTREEFEGTIQEIWDKICEWSQELLESLKEAGVNLLDDTSGDQEEDEGSEYASEDQEEGEGLECSQEVQEED